ncbi:MAG: hypothetical protein IKI97_06475 [Clostridia bacterium]|nr:hypothetical protein [Clostridia bacterium]
MLEPILKGLVECLYEMMVDIMSYASGELLGVMSMDLSYFESTAPIISDIVNVFIALGWALLIGNLVFQSLKAIMSGAGFEAEDPKILFLRTFVFAFLLLASREICNIGSSITGTVIDMLELPNAITVTTPDESMFSLGSGAKWLLVIIVGVVLMVQMVKLLFEIGERYVITSVLTFFAPLAFAMGGSKNTNDIFKGWVRMYASMLVMMIMNIVFLKLIMSAMSQMAAGGVLVWLVFVVALTRVARKIDSHIGKIGLNPAQTGNEIGSRLPGVMTFVAVRTMSSLIGRSMANAKGGSGGKSGRNGNTGRGGSAGRGRNPNPSGPRPSGGYGGASPNVNNMGGSSTVNGGMNVNTGGVNTSVGGSNVNAGKTNASNATPGGNTTGQSGTSFKGGNAPRPANAPNVTHTGNGGTTVNQGVHNTGQQGAVHESVQNKGATQRPPIPRGTAGAHPQGVNPMSSVVNGGVHPQGNPSMPNQNGGTQKKGTTVKGSNPIIPPPVVSGGVKQNVSGSVQHGGGKTVVDTDVVHSRSDVKGTTQRGGNVSGGSVQSTQIGGNSGGVNIGGSTQISGNEHFTDRSSERFHDSHTRGHTQTNTRQETTERKVNHEYKHGRYNPAAANKKVKKTYYQKDNPAGVRSNNNPHVKRGENNRTKHKR